jgi:hypothetical protein
METVTSSRGKLIAFKILVWLFALGAFFGLFGFTVISAWWENSDGGIHRVHYMAFGALFGVILTTALVVQHWNPHRKISSFYSILDVGLTMLIAGGLAESPTAAVFGLGILVAYGILFALHPYRRLLTHPPREGFSVLLMALTIGGAIPLIWFATTTARLQRNGLPIDPHIKNEHWTLMTAMLIGIVLVAFLSAFKFAGWKITARSAGAALFFYGLIATVYPHKAGSNGTGWSLAALFGGLVFVAAAEWESRKAVSTASA